MLIGGPVAPHEPFRWAGEAKRLPRNSGEGQVGVFTVVLGFLTVMVGNVVAVVATVGGERVTGGGAVSTGTRGASVEAGIDAEVDAVVGAGASDGERRRGSWWSCGRRVCGHVAAFAVVLAVGIGKVVVVVAILSLLLISFLGVARLRNRAVR